MIFRMNVAANQAFPRPNSYASSVGNPFEAFALAMAMAWFYDTVLRNSVICRNEAEYVCGRDMGGV
jgi:hypothetical protein